MKLSHLLAAAALGFSSLAAQASLISISGGNQYNIPGVGEVPLNKINNFEANFPTNQTYWIGANLLSATTGKLEITYTYIAHEAGWNNQFHAGGQEITVNPLSTPTIVNTETVSVGQALSFYFTTPNTLVGSRTVTNGANVPGTSVAGPQGGPYNYAVALGTTFTKNNVSTYYDAVLFLDDTGYAPDDDNHDDLIIGVKVRAVPEPSTILLMGLGLLGLAGARRIKA